MVQPAEEQWIESIAVTAAEMAAIEARIFEAGMPVAALMEKVAGRITQWLVDRYPCPRRVLVLVGPGHNGGDALVVARELWLRGYEVHVCCPFEKTKELTAAHRRYAEAIALPQSSQLPAIAPNRWDVIIDGLFGFGLQRPITGAIAALVDQINATADCPVVSIDLPSGLHTDTGAVLGTALRASHTLCLGLWKRAFLQEAALPYLGKVERLGFDIPRADIEAVLGTNPSVRRLTTAEAIAALPPLPPTTHKYRQGHLLLVAGSRTYAGAAILAALGARSSGVGMLSIAIPESLHGLMVAQVPDAVVIPCPETSEGAIASYSERIDFSRYDAIAYGPGLTRSTTALLEPVLDAPCVLVLDADGLNQLADGMTKGSTEGTTEGGLIDSLHGRSHPTLLTPHWGEFQRLFPDLIKPSDRAMSESLPQGDRLTLVWQVAQRTGAIVLLKGARVAIASPDELWINPDSTPALARGGSGDVLTGLAGGLLAQRVQALGKGTVLPKAIAHHTLNTAAWWHAQAGRLAAQHRTERGVDAHTLTQYLSPALAQVLANFPHIP